MTSSPLPIQVATGILCASWWRGSWYILDHTLFPDDTLKSGVVSLAAGSSLLAMKQYILSPSYNGTKTLMRWLPPPKNVSLRTRYTQTNRFIVLYGIATACVLIWRGTWLLCDEGAHALAEACSGKLVGPVSSIPEPVVAKPKTERELSAGISSGLNDHHHGESTVTNHKDLNDKVLFYSGIASHIVATLGLLCMGRFASVMAPPANVTMSRDTFIHGKGKSFAQAARAFLHSR
ncbi:hypothetical protein HJC23_001253 [Cyclotella cryptica]|uniref:Uncharacterized protein n=1 Tax=Cyclotella cryptica TaxID=29204 RepID=A0ABD3NSR1_9STRA|eukprot:CCRYP_020042-RA/>CCRYP_020042-RA protein AED:0.24 eAED:0.24 QI:0/-1/0/1/-1/1/1/0/233